MRRQFAFITILLLTIAESGHAEVVCKTKTIRDGDYRINVFFQGDEEIAMQKIGAKGTLEERGKIPDGKVSFIDEDTKTYGEEFYKKGEKNGFSKTYYEDGTLLKEAFYARGTLITEKEYYKNGQLRLEADYSQAELSSPAGHEPGNGKIYYRNGALKYEWSFDQHGGYQKGYNKDGEKRYEAIYDDEGNRVQNYERPEQ